MNPTYVLLVDLQRDFLEANGRLPIGAARTVPLLAGVARLIGAGHAGRVGIILVTSEFLPTDRLGNFFRNYSALRGSVGAEIDPRIAGDGFPVFSKCTSDAFSNPKLLAYLKTKEFCGLAIGGVFAEGCIRATAASAIRKGYKVTILSDAVESDKSWKKSAALWDLRRRGASISSCDEFLEKLANQTPEPTIASGTSPTGQEARPR